MKLNSESYSFLEVEIKYKNFVKFTQCMLIFSPNLNKIIVIKYSIPFKISVCIRDYNHVPIQWLISWYLARDLQSNL